MGTLEPVYSFTFPMNASEVVEFFLEGTHRIPGRPVSVVQSEYSNTFFVGTLKFGSGLDCLYDGVFEARLLVPNIQMQQPIEVWHGWPGKISIRQERVLESHAELVYIVGACVSQSRYEPSDLISSNIPRGIFTWFDFVKINIKQWWDNKISDFIDRQSSMPTNNFQAEPQGSEEQIEPKVSNTQAEPRKRERGRPSHTDDLWAWEQVNIHRRPRAEVKSEWAQRPGVIDRQLQDIDRSFRHAVNRQLD